MVWSTAQGNEKQGSVWGGGIRDTTQDATGARPAGRSEEAKKGLITQRQAAEELGQSERHIRRLLVKLGSKGDRAVIHALRGRQSNRKVAEKTRADAVAILSRKVYQGFGPTLAGEYLGKKHGIRRQPRGSARLDDRSPVVVTEGTGAGDGSHMAREAGTVRRNGAVGHQRARLAGRTRAKAQRSAMQLQVTPQQAHVLFGRVVLPEPCVNTAGSVVDYADQIEPGWGYFANAGGMV